MIEDRKIECIEAIDWLKAHYGDELDSRIVSAQFCQSSQDVYLKIITQIDTAIGKKTIEEVINLEFIADPYDTPLDIVPDGESPLEKRCFIPNVSIEVNAPKFFSDKITLLNTTPLFG